MKKFFKTFLLSLAVFSLCFYGINKFSNSKSKSADPKDGEFAKLDDSEINRNLDNRLQFVLMGIDDGGLDVEKGVRSDTIIAFDVNFDNGKIKGLTIPRDSRVLVRGRMDKINHAHSYGGKELAMTTINDFLDTEIPYYVRIDFKGVMKVVDAIGGVEMDVPVDMVYSDPTAKPALNINIRKGPQLLSGKQSHDVIRYRHPNGTDTYPGGFSREKVQQMWLQAFVKSALRPKNIAKLPSLIKTYFDSVDTNIPMTDILGYGLKAGKIDPALMEISMTPEAEPGKIIGSAWYYLPDEEKTREMAYTIFKALDLDEDKPIEDK